MASQLGVLPLLNPTKKDFTYAYNGEEITIPAGKTVVLPEAAAYDLSYHLAQRILDAKGLPFFGDAHSQLQAELIGLAEPSFFDATVESVEEVKTKSGKRKDVKVKLEEDKLVDVPDVSEEVKPEENAPELGNIVLDE